MRRPDNAAEVRFDNKLIGWLTSTSGQSLSGSIFTLRWHEPSPPGTSLTHELRLRVETLAWSISRSKCEEMGAEDGARHVREHTPGYAEEQVDELRQILIYRWRVLVPESLDDCERLFDRQDFEPIELGEPDLDAIPEYSLRDGEKFTFVSPRWEAPSDPSHWISTEKLEAGSIHAASLQVGSINPGRVALSAIPTPIPTLKPKE